MANWAEAIPPDTKLPTITAIRPITLAIGALPQVVITGTQIICGAVRADFGTLTHRHVPSDLVRPTPVNAPRVKYGHCAARDARVGPLFARQKLSDIKIETSCPLWVESGLTQCTNISR